MPEPHISNHAEHGDGRVAVWVGACSAHWGECQALIPSLWVKSQAVQITSNNVEKDRDGLVAKLNESAVKLDRAKFCDSIAKLNDFKAECSSSLRQERFRSRTLISSAVMQTAQSHVL